MHEYNNPAEGRRRGGVGMGSVRGQGTGNTAWTCPVCQAPHTNTLKTTCRMPGCNGTQRQSTQAPKSRCGCCGKKGHVAKECWFSPEEGRAQIARQRNQQQQRGQGRGAEDAAGRTNSGGMEDANAGHTGEGSGGTKWETKISGRNPFKPGGNKKHWGRSSP